MPEFYQIKSHEPAWGDYGHILIHGMGSHLGREQGILQLERTGPFIPPMSLPGLPGIVVTRALQSQLEEAKFTGFHFAPVIKQLIVWFEWEKWDLDAPEPAEHPESGEPEDYILGRPHSAKAANKMPLLSELVVDAVVRIDRGNDFAIITSSWNGEDFVGGDSTLHRFVSKRAKEWLEPKVSPWVRFIQHKTTP